METPISSNTDTAANTPAIILGADVGGLGVARSLGMAGIPAILVDDDTRHPGMHSRYGRPFVMRDSDLSLADGLLRLRECISNRPVLFARTDRQVQIISEHRERLTAAFHIRLPEHVQLHELLDKAGFQQLAERHGFPIPRAVTVRSENDLARLSDIRFPAVIKMVGTEPVPTSTLPRVSRVSSRTQADSVCRALLRHVPGIIVQQWIEGADSDIYFCLQYRGAGGMTVSSFTGRKLRCWPPQIGRTASCTAAPESASELERLTTHFFDQVGFVGPGSMEFKRERKTGKFFMIEPTVGRTDWQEEVASLNGVNIPLAAYCYELGLPLPLPARLRNPLIWSYTPWYWRSVLVSMTLKDARPPSAKQKSACWRADDPVPLLYDCLEWVRNTKWKQLANLGKWRQQFSVVSPMFSNHV
jgi:predicted ATP-grasp superfamily ATP-dependent carboligase